MVQSEERREAVVYGAGILSAAEAQRTEFTVDGRGLSSELLELNISITDELGAEVSSGQ